MNQKKTHTIWLIVIFLSTCCLAQAQDTDKFVKFEKVKMVRFIVNSKGDTIAEKKGYPIKLVYVEDSTMILHLYKGKRYTGKAIFLTKIKNKKGE